MTVPVRLPVPLPLSDRDGSPHAHAPPHAPPTGPGPQTFAHELAHNGASCKAHNEAFAGQMGLVASSFMPALMEFMKTVPAEV
jgi:hypothetical protein